MATVNAAEILNDIENGWLKSSEIDRKNHRRPAMVPFAQTFTIPSTSTALNSIVRLFKWPAGAYVWDFRCTPSDMDTDVTPTLSYSILTTDDSDVTVLTLTAASTKARTGSGSDNLDTALVGRYVGNSWCVWKATAAAATGAAGTINCAWLMSIGVINRRVRGVYMKDANS